MCRLGGLPSRDSFRLGPALAGMRFLLLRLYRYQRSLHIQGARTSCIRSLQQLCRDYRCSYYTPEYEIWRIHTYDAAAVDYYTREYLVYMYDNLAVHGIRRVEHYRTSLWWRRVLDDFMRL